MGDDPPDKTSDRNPVSESTARQIQTPGATPVESTRPFNARHHSGFTEARYGNNPNPSLMNMGSMAYALPGHHSQQYEQQMSQYPAHGQGMMYPMPPIPMAPYGHNTGGMAYAVPYPAYPPYAIPQHPGQAQHGTHYQPYVSNPSMQSVGPAQAPPYGSGYYPQSAYGAPCGVPLAGRMLQPGSISHAHKSPKPGSLRKEVDKRVADLEYDVSKTIVDGSNPMKSVSQTLPSDNSLHSTQSTPTTPRGPPRKPKQSGHALWVGNLPPGANVMDLKDHFSQDATNDIESVFLISKSNCAFVNYKSAAACVTALARFHDSRFQGVRVVCRLRKGFSAPGSAPTASSVNPRPRPEDIATEPGDEPTITSEISSASPATGQQPPPARVVDRYFIVKSLTVEDLELSGQSGIWATQSHNEAAMNQAYETADNVYLIFSANKSGEYFGYARMISPISDDEELALEVPPRPDPPPGDPDDLDVTLTIATSTAPRGRIIDDSARGTIFWEVESSGDENDDTRSEKSVEPDESEEGQSFGKPFRIQWVSTERVPFHRTRGLRNPWNANREVKIARDGTEIEPTIGRKLIQLFHLP
ncbi:hypothetical protein N7467_005813 [Penicillium canescens]|nr:hypothetical protein N7467_005813 [Penicillium canescens]